MWPRLLLLLLVSAVTGCVGDDTGATSQATGAADTAAEGPCGGATCDPVSEYCVVRKGEDESAGQCAGLPPSPPCVPEDPCACLVTLCKDPVCGISDHGWALLSCDFP